MEQVFLPLVLHDFWRKIFLTLQSINWLDFAFWLRFLYEILGNMCIIIVYFPVCEVINFEIIFLSRAFLRGQKCKDKNLNIVRTKRAFKMKQKAFFITFKELSLKQIKPSLNKLKQIKPTILEGESPTLTYISLFVFVN